MTPLFALYHKFKGRSYAIGDIRKDGLPLETSFIFNAWIDRERKNTIGTYVNADGQAKSAADAAVLDMLGVKPEYRESCRVFFTPMSGTGANNIAKNANFYMYGKKIKALANADLSWPVHDLYALMRGLALKKFGPEDAYGEQGVYSIFQCGPHNTTGITPLQPVWIQRAEKNRGTGIPVHLDIQYLGFMSAFRIFSGEMTYDEAIRREFEISVEPFFERGVTCAIALGFTKCCITFADRTYGAVIVFSKDGKELAELSRAVKLATTEFEGAGQSPLGRGTIRAFAKDPEKIRQEYEAVLRYVGSVRAMCERLTRGGPLYPYFDPKNKTFYSGIFRNIPIKKDAAEAVYSVGLFPAIFLEPPRMRINITCFPGDESEAGQDLSAFAAQVQGS